jgi:HNH endonuclease
MKYTKELVQDAVNQSKSVMEVMRILGIKLSGGSHNHITSVIKKFEIDTSHFLGQASNKGKPAKSRLTADEIFSSVPEYRTKAEHLNRALLESGVEYKCVICGNTGIWNNKPLTLQVDHIDGDWKNNKKENLRFLCPCCHSQTENYGNKNMPV